MYLWDVLDEGSLAATPSGCGASRVVSPYIRGARLGGQGHPITVAFGDAASASCTTVHKYGRPRLLDQGPDRGSVLRTGRRKYAGVEWDFADLESVRLVCVVHDAVGESSGATQPSGLAGVIPSPPTVFP